MSWVPTFKLYAANGSTLLYTFPNVTRTNAPQSIEEAIEVNNIRASGSLILGGGLKSWDLEFRFIIIGTDYTDVTSKIDSLESAVAFNTPYVLKIDKSISTTYAYNVKRIEPFIYEDSLRTKLQAVICRLKVLAW